jgi:Fur family ferric uptake transcriptional regulator
MATRRNTLQRKIILEELQHSRAHATAAELYQIVRHSVPRLSLGTVYRNLDILHREGLVKKIEGFGRETRFDADLENHYHLRCLKCGRIEDVDNPVAVKVEGNITTGTGWVVLEPQVEFHGLCPDCRARSAAGTTVTEITLSNSEE